VNTLKDLQSQHNTANGPGNKLTQHLFKDDSDFTQIIPMPDSEIELMNKTIFQSKRVDHQGM
jgi:hypothetical protein